MKDKIHPKYEETTVTCTCGNVIETRSTQKDLKIEICSSGHPFTRANRRSSIQKAAWKSSRKNTA